MKKPPFLKRLITSICLRLPNSWRLTPTALREALKQGLRLTVTLTLNYPLNRPTAASSAGGWRTSGSSRLSPVSPWLKEYVSGACHGLFQGVSPGRDGGRSAGLQLMFPVFFAFNLWLKP
jgi:hypothetical protein